MLLFEGGTEAVHASVTIQAEEAGAIEDGVPISEDQDRRREKFVKELAVNVFHGSGV